MAGRAILPYWANLTIAGRVNMPYWANLTISGKAFINIP
jgi:hypothetical protein